MVRAMLKKRVNFSINRRILEMFKTVVENTPQCNNNRSRMMEILIEQRFTLMQDPINYAKTMFKYYQNRVCDMNQEAILWKDEYLKRKQKK